MTAITSRENALLALEHKVPEYIPSLKFECYNFLIPELLERGPSHGPHEPFGGTGFDWFGVHWTFIPSVRAPMVSHEYPPLLNDITKWKEVVRFPDLNAVDWASASARDLSDPAFTRDKLSQLVILNGPFERMHSLMGMVDALCSLKTDSEACYDFFGAVIDYKMSLIDKILKYYPIDLLDFHDDWGHQHNSFFSVETWCDLLKPHVKKLTSFCKEKGVHLQWHSCGYVENLIPEMVDAGIEHWSSCQAVNNIENIIKEYGSKLTVFGGMDLEEYKASDMTLEKLTELVGQRIDKLCKGGALLPLGLNVIPGLAEAVTNALAVRKDFFKNPENCILPH